MRNGLVSALCLCAAALLALPASADIAAYNKAVQAGDFKTAAKEAAATWPTLDKSGEDIAIIAREFGYAAYIAQDYQAMRTYAVVAADPATPGNTEPLGLAIATVLLRNAEHHIKPTSGTRKGLYDALLKRSEMPGLDKISLSGIDTLVDYDMDNQNWESAAASTQLGGKMAISGGASVNLIRRRLELLNAIATFLDDKEWASYKTLDDLNEAIMADMEAAASDKLAASYVPLRWETVSWRMLVQSYMSAGGGGIPAKYKTAHTEDDVRTYSPRLTGLLDLHPKGSPCKRKLNMKRKIQYPESAMFRGFVGSVILSVDIDAAGNAKNPRVLSSIPEKFFSETVLKAVPGFEFKPDPKAWTADTCRIEHEGHIVEVQFMIG
jgi:TonB family protein